MNETERTAYVVTKRYKFAIVRVTVVKETAKSWMLKKRTDWTHSAESAVIFGDTYDYFPIRLPKPGHLFFTCEEAAQFAADELDVSLEALRLRVQSIEALQAELARFRGVTP